MKLNKHIKNIFRFLIKNYFITIFLACIAFVVLVSGYRLFFTKPTFVYVKVKMSQGLWWATTQKPSVWFIKSIKKGDVQTDLVGEPTAEILEVRHYPTLYPNQYDVYLDMKLKVSGSQKTGKYNFNRSAIGVGAPVDFEFPSSQFSGTIIDLSENPITDKHIEKTVYLNKPFAYLWEYDALKINDKFFDGEEYIIEIIDKNPGDYITANSQFMTGIGESTTQIRQGITVKLKIKGKMVNSLFVFGNDQIITPGKIVYFATENFNFNDYIVSGIE